MFCLQVTLVPNYFYGIPLIKHIQVFNLLRKRLDSGFIKFKFGIDGHFIYFINNLLLQYV